MTLCEKCIHGDVCGDRDGYDEGDERALIFCSEFKSKDDVVEVVRCKDCKHSYFVKSCSKYECRKGCGILKFSNDFCSYGERKEQNNG